VATSKVRLAWVPLRRPAIFALRLGRSLVVIVTTSHSGLDAAGRRWAAMIPRSEVGPMNDSTGKRMVGRRQLIRGAGVLGTAAVVTAATAPAAHASDGDDLVLGQANQASHTTALCVAAGTSPTVTLANAHGPQLHLSPSSNDYPILAVGDILNLSDGPLIGIDDGDGGAQTSILVTGADLPYAVPTAFPQEPQRLLDTRYASGRTAIARTSTGAINKAGQLVAGHWMDLFVGEQGVGYDLYGVFFNVAVLSPLASGYLSVYVPSGGGSPSTSTVVFHTGVSISNGGMVGVESYLDKWIVRIYSSQTTHVVLDLTGDISTAAAPDAKPSTPRVRALTRAARASQARTTHTVRRR
jgi:hypothetical protein